MATQDDLKNVREQGSVEELVPPKEELLTMTRAQLDEIKQQIVAETARKLSEDPDMVEKLRLTLERDSAIKVVENKGQFADPALKVIQSGSLAPLDHQEAVAKPHKTDPSKVYRFINKADENLYSLRRHQGYEPIKDETGNEVRYMDGVLATMPKERYDREIRALTEAKKILKRTSARKAADDFKELAAREGSGSVGHGVRVDIEKE